MFIGVNSENKFEKCGYNNKIMKIKLEIMQNISQEVDV